MQETTRCPVCLAAFVTEVSIKNRIATPGSAAAQRDQSNELTDFVGVMRFLLEVPANADQPSRRWYEAYTRWAVQHQVEPVTIQLFVRRCSRLGMELYRTASVRMMKRPEGWTLAPVHREQMARVAAGIARDLDDAAGVAERPHVELVVDDEPVIDDEADLERIRREYPRDE